MTIIDTAPFGRADPSAPTTIQLVGDIDFLTGPALREALLSALLHSRSLLILDLSGVTFCDARGLSVLAGVQNRARSMGITLALTAPSRNMSRLLRITGMDHSMPMVRPSAG
ncbi:STAS domain-containing protein [Actinoallomurus sp. NPDC050550]|uniref:STAS domain-containing protein n=1 Tax=Actinoallomurus sp. NPDC050550 TaxID=3154937 RepID=UPI0033EDC20D